MNKNQYWPWHRAFATLVRKHLVIAALWGAFFVASPAHAADAVRTFNIPAQSAATALNEFARQADITLAFSYELVSGERTNAVHGDLLVLDALARLLKGTKLGYKRVSDKTIAIDAASTSASRSDQKPPQGAAYAQGDPSGQVRLAQVDQGPASNPPEKSERPSEKKPVWIEEIVVTGSRIPTHAKEGAQEVKLYTRDQIEQRGVATISEFLNSLPSVSTAIGENGIQTFEGNTTVQIHGLPIGTTLVLINGRRVETNASNFFDLNNIPLAAVERVEVVSAGSSAVYGSDAIAGIVNIVLRKNFEGFEVNARYGRASGIDDSDVGLAWGKRWGYGSASLIGSFQTRGALTGAERSITANQDFRPSGGVDARSPDCNPGNVYSTNGGNLPGTTSTFAGVPVGFIGTPTQQEFAATAGTLNKCSHNIYASFIPATDRVGILAEGSYQLTGSVELFTELMYAHVKQRLQGAPPDLNAFPSFSFFPYTVPASNPYNPFGVTVGISNLLTAVGSQSIPFDTEFVRPLVGAKGAIFKSWEWEVTGWESQDTSQFSQTNFPNSTAIEAALSSTDPTAALNPFVDGPPGSPSLLQSLVFTQVQKYRNRTTAANAFMRGPLFDLPSGHVDVVVGGEYGRDSLYTDLVNSPFAAPNTQSTFRRERHAFFGEVRVPILANHEAPQAGDVVAVTIAGRYDHYDDFGNKATPQLGAEWRPFDTVLIRATYGKAFKAPSLSDLHQPIFVFPSAVLDPKNGNNLEFITEHFGGNPQLQPETGQSRTFGVVYSSKMIPDLQLSLTHWSVDESNSVQQLPAQTLVNNESLFPANVIRASCSSPPCPITQVNALFVNFGELDLAGLDYQASYKVHTHFGQLLPSLSATQTYRYKAALQPGLPPTNRTSMASDDGNWAPRWKGTVALGWQLGPYAANLDGRYTGRYQDYDSTREIGNYWLYDLSVRYAVGQALARNDQWLKGTYLELGGINIFNRLPEYSNYQFGTVGYDPAQADLRGRFLYARFGVKW